MKKQCIAQLLSVLLFMIYLTGCSQITVDAYSNLTPILVPEEFFNGKLTAHGVVKNRSGKVIRYFNANINAYWQDGIGVLEEDFIFNDGEEQFRRWELKPTGNGRYIATANDTVGEGDMQVAGNSLFLNYVLQVPYKGRVLDIAVDDRMYLVDDSTIVNESKMRKWGFHVGEVLLTIIKH